MAHDQLVGTSVVNASATSKATTVNFFVPVGYTVLGGITVESAAGTIPTVSTVTDSRGNTWTTTPDTSYGGASNVTVAGVLLRGTITTALQVGDSITVTLSAARVRWALQFDSFDDLIASPKDVAAQNNNPGSATSLVSGTTAATAQAYELNYAIFGFGSARSPVVQAGWDGTASVESSAGSSDRALQCVYQYTSATGAQTAPLTLGTASTYGGAICTYKASRRGTTPVNATGYAVQRAGSW